MKRTLAGPAGLDLRTSSGSLPPQCWLLIWSAITIISYIIYSFFTLSDFHFFFNFWSNCYCFLVSHTFMRINIIVIASKIDIPKFSLIKKVTQIGSDLGVFVTLREPKLVDYTGYVPTATSKSQDVCFRQFKMKTIAAFPFCEPIFGLINHACRILCNWCKIDHYLSTQTLPTYIHLWSCHVITQPSQYISQGPIRPEINVTL